MGTGTKAGWRTALASIAVLAVVALSAAAIVRLTGHPVALLALN